VDLHINTQEGVKIPHHKPWRNFAPCWRLQLPWCTDRSHSHGCIGQWLGHNTWPQPPAQHRHTRCNGLLIMGWLAISTSTAILLWLTPQSIAAPGRDILATQPYCIPRDGSRGFLDSLSSLQEWICLQFTTFVVSECSVGKQKSKILHYVCSTTGPLSLCLMLDASQDKITRTHEVSWQWQILNSPEGSDITVWSATVQPTYWCDWSCKPWSGFWCGRSVTVRSS
jgi:hypothetical protein